MVVLDVLVMHPSASKFLLEKCCLGPKPFSDPFFKMDVFFLRNKLFKVGKRCDCSPEEMSSVCLLVDMLKK